MTLRQNFYSKVSQIDRILESRNITADFEKRVISLIAEDENLRSYFLKKVTGLGWFKLLDDNKYFDPNQIKFDKDSNALFWNILEYLEKVSEQIDQNPQYSKELINIIESIVQFSLTKKRINNYHIWWYCVKILNNLPSPIILKNITINQFLIWLLEWTDPSLGGDLTISDIGEKLLGKFLKDDDMLPYAEAIIGAITGICAGEKKQAFTKREDAVLIWKPYWILDAFRKYHKEIGLKCSDSIIYGLADKLKKVLEYKQKESYVLLEIGRDIYRIRACRVNKDNLQSGEIDFKDFSFECDIRQYSPDQIRESDNDKNLLVARQIEPQLPISKFLIEKFKDKNKFIESIKSILSRNKNINWEEVKDFDKKISYLYESLFEDYSQVWFKSLASGGSEHASGAEEVLTIILRDVLLSRCEAKKSEVKPILESFLHDKYRFPIFRKFVLLCLDKHWDDYPDLFEKFVMSASEALEKSSWEVELQDLLRNHNEKFNPKLKDKLKELIEDVPEYYQKEGKKLVAYWKYKWFSPLKDNPEFSEMYNEAKKQAEVKDDKPYEPERSAFKSGFVGHKSPLSREEILRKPMGKLVKFLKEFEGADFWHGAFEGEPDKEGLAGELRAAAKESPGKFIDELDSFNQPGLYRYVNCILGGFRDASGEKKLLPWGKIFNFSQKYIKQPWFLDEASKDQRGDSGKGEYIWVVDEIVNLIEESSRDNEQAVEPGHFNIVENIFNSLLPLVKAEKHPDTQHDAVTYTLNTTLGKVIESYIIFSLRVARVRQKNNEEKEKKWGVKYERFFEKGIETYIWFGRYLPNLKFLDEDWVKNKIKSLSNQSVNDFEWQMFMEGYLTGPYVYEELYDLMRPNYYKAIENKVFEERIDNRLVQHITIGYLRGYELLKQKNDNDTESLFWKMLDEATTPKKRDRWLETASFFWSISGRSIRRDKKEEISEDSKKKILAFWEWTYKHPLDVQKKLGDDYPSFLGRLAELTILLDKIDDTTFEWLMLSAPYVDLHHNSVFFFEYLTKFEDEESIKQIGKIFLKVLEHTTPTFKREDIQFIVGRLYDLGKKDPNVKRDADNICNTYGRRGVHFLKDLFYKHQQKKD